MPPEVSRPFTLSGSGELFAKAACAYLGTPFVNHAKVAQCGSRYKTYPDCMEIGLTTRGFDCSGLVHAALSDVTHRSMDWVYDTRHVAQIVKSCKTYPVEELTELPIGTLLIYDHVEPNIRVRDVHVAVWLGNNQVVHARQSPLGALVGKDDVRTPWASKKLAGVIDPYKLLEKTGVP